MNQVGSIVFGPLPSTTAGRDWSLAVQGLSTKATEGYHACNCLGPQPGQTKCPCALRAESERGRRMITDGVTINSKLYKLVEASDPFPPSTYQAPEWDGA